jgi:hypothetical protein
LEERLEEVKSGFVEIRAEREGVIALPFGE